jgi:hypothetical protein
MYLVEVCCGSGGLSTARFAVFRCYSEKKQREHRETSAYAAETLVLGILVGENNSDDNSEKQRGTANDNSNLRNIKTYKIRYIFGKRQTMP